ncbi:TetR/AcrR family transcriptional regulator [Streptomyces sp. Ac-502]|uniref:TetR/AcrR family transcriptional regulator n=1 Tax=Streptomyces sp. Ac-502 TaxID=3342801 RepID=UPI00386293A6
MGESAAVRPRNPRGQGERLREELLRATERLLEEVGSEDALSLRAVAREAGVAAPSIYRHFADKTELVWAALEVSYERLRAAMAEASAAADTDDPVDLLRAQLRAYCRYAVEHPAKYRLLYETRQTPVEPERLAATRRAVWCGACTTPSPRARPPDGGCAAPARRRRTCCGRRCTAASCCGR